MNEAETRAERIDPALKAAGWGEQCSQAPPVQPSSRVVDDAGEEEEDSRSGERRSQAVPGQGNGGEEGEWRSRLVGRWISPKGKRGGEWFSRGYLPHREAQCLIQHVTVHLADSLSASARERIRRFLVTVPEERRDSERRQRSQAWLDAGHGCCALRHPEMAQMMQDALLHFHGERYELHAWAIMPNHWHALFELIEDWTVAQVVTSWKKYTARRIRAYLAPRAVVGTIADLETPGSAALPSGSLDRVDRATTPFPKTVWHREYWDRYTRDERHYSKAVEYIHGNPVKAGLAQRPEDWPWSSAGGSQ